MARPLSRRDDPAYCKEHSKLGQPMSDVNTLHATDLTGLTADLVSAYVSNGNNRVDADALPALIVSVYTALNRLGAPAAATLNEPAVEHKSKSEIKKSFGAEHLISFEDGKPYKSLKRHLSAHRLTPDEYRAKWGLPRDYPMVHPTYSAARSAMAKSMGLGAGGRQPTKAAPKAKPPRKAKA